MNIHLSNPTLTTIAASLAISSGIAAGIAAAFGALVYRRFKKQTKNHVTVTQILSMMVQYKQREGKQEESTHAGFAGVR